MNLFRFFSITALVVALGATAPAQEAQGVQADRLLALMEAKLRKAKAVFSAFTVNADNSIVAKPIWQVPHRCDGMCVDTEGRLYLTENKGITILNADGSKVGVIPLDEHPANICFGGPKMQTLYITARKSLYRLKTTATGSFPKAK